MWWYSPKGMMLFPRQANIWWGTMHVEILFISMQ